MSTKTRVQEIFDKFQVELKVSDTKLATAKLDSGQEIETDAEAFETGASVFVVNDEGERIALPDGEYILEDGTAMMVADGVIVEIPEVEKEAEAVEEVEVVASLSSEDVSKMIADALKPILEVLSLQTDEMEKLSKRTADKPLPRAKMQPKKLTKVDLKNMTTNERVKALTQQFA